VQDIFWLRCALKAYNLGPRDRFSRHALYCADRAQQLIRCAAPQWPARLRLSRTIYGTMPATGNSDSSGRRSHTICKAAKTVTRCAAIDPYLSIKATVET